MSTCQNNISLNNPSICIPRVFTHISNNEIINIFQNKLNIGPVKKVDVIYNDYNHTQNKNKNKNKNNNHRPNCKLHPSNNLVYNIANNNDVSEHKFKKVFIHFKYWNDTHHHIKDTLNEGKTIKVVYDNPWFWKCSLSRNK